MCPFDWKSGNMRGVFDFELILHQTCDDTTCIKLSFSF